MERLRRKELLEERDTCPLTLEEPLQLGRCEAPGSLAPELVDGQPLGRRGEPSRRVFGRGASRPHLHRAPKCLLGDVFGERQVVHAEDSNEDREQPAPFVAEEVRLEREVHLLLHLHERPDLDAPADRENRAPHRKLHGLVEILGLYDRVAADHVFGLGEKTVGDHALLAT